MVKFIRIKNKFYNLSYVKEIIYSDGYWEIVIANTEISNDKYKYKTQHLKDKYIFCHEDDLIFCDDDELTKIIGPG
jgi:hypothetical protein